MRYGGQRHNVVDTQPLLSFQRFLARCETEASSLRPREARNAYAFDAGQLTGSSPQACLQALGFTGKNIQRAVLIDDEGSVTSPRGVARHVDRLCIRGPDYEWAS